MQYDYNASQKQESTLLQTYVVCTEQIFDSRTFKYSLVQRIVNTFDTLWSENY